MGYNFPVHRLAGLAVFPISTVLVAILLGWLLDRSGSIWAPRLGHASLNAVGGSLTLLLYPDPAHRLYTGVLGVLGWVPLAILCLAITLGRGRHGDRHRRS